MERLRILRAATLATALVAVTLTNWQASAQTKPVQSCYELVPKLSIKTPNVHRVLLVLVDETVLFDDSLRSDAIRKVEEFLAPGDRILIGTFSAFDAARYTQIVFDGRLDMPLSDSDRFYTGKNVLRQFDECLGEQTEFVRRRTADEMAKSFATASETVAHSEIAGTLAQLSPELKLEKNATQVVLITSDMLENSSITSFYRKGELRLIDPAIEVEKFRKVALIADLANAHVFVEGAAFSAGHAYVSDDRLRALREFWSQYLQASHAQLAGFGTPLLIEPLR